MCDQLTNDQAVWFLEFFSDVDSVFRDERVFGTRERERAAIGRIYNFWKKAREKLEGGTR